MIAKSIWWDLKKQLKRKKEKKKDWKWSDKFPMSLTSLPSGRLLVRGGGG